MKSRIQERLRELEDEHGFRILYACESGSRAWGFASEDSDYDIRFIYAWPQVQYLGIFDPSSIIDLGVDEEDLDIT
ncbi:MAG: nucleotidyltransferase domain-containing protein, partial [Verrucomicrobiota bacterium]